MRNVGLVNENGVVDELAEVLKRLENVLGLFGAGAGNLARCEGLRLRVREVVVELLLERR